MKKIASKGRLLLRKILVGLGAGAVALMFQACYAMPPPDDGVDYPLGQTTKSVVLDEQSTE